MGHFQVCVCVFLCWTTIGSTTDTVETLSGTVKGTVEKTIGKNITFYAFKGIPFAEPPIGNLRFEPPLAKKPWDGVLEAVSDPPACIQTNSDDDVVGSEDCLYLNVYVPQNPNEDLLPVMVWIYGGGFEAGFNAYSEFGPDYLLEKGVIVVTINYRVGILGFLSLGDLVVPGNNGLKDQVLALKWVRSNIEQFGGNPNQVTIFGQSAGSASVSYLLQSPLTEGLFQQAIMESGVSFSLWAYSRSSVAIAYSTCNEYLNITSDSSQELVKALRTFDAEEIQVASKKAAGHIYLTVNPRDGFMFAPVLEPEHDGAFLTERSYLLMQTGHFHHVPCIIGYNSMEGTFNFGAALRVYLTKYDTDISGLTPADMNIYDKDQKTAIGKIIKNYYFGIVPLFLSDGYKIMKYISDDQFARPIIQFARLLSSHSRVYFYRFTYEGGMGGITNRTVDGVAHSEELGYLWRRNQIANQTDALTRRRMVSMWTNFAKYGDPTPYKTDLLDVKWPLATDSLKSDYSLQYLEIGYNLTSKSNPQMEDIDFWDKLYAAYGIPPYDTY